MPAAPRSLAVSFLATPRGPFLLGAAVTLSTLALQIASNHKPWSAHAPLEISNQLVAAMGFAWAALQLWTARRDRDLRLGWLFACLGMGLLIVEDGIDRFVPIRGFPVASIFATIALWLAAAGLLFACGRRHAMRRSVMTVMRGALAVQLAVHTFALVSTLTASLRSHSLFTLTNTVSETGELVAVIAYVFALFLAVLAPLKSYDRPLSRLGAKARDIYRDFRLEDCARYPTRWRVLNLPIARELTLAAMIPIFLKKGAASAAADGGGSPLRQAARMARLAFRRGVDPYSFYLLGLYRDARTSVADAALTRFETKNGLTRALQKTREPSAFPGEMNDKLAFWRICEDGGVRSAPILALFEARACDVFAEKEGFDRDLFVKDRNGRGGKFTLNFTRVAPFAYRDDAGAPVSLADVFSRLAALSADRRLILQPKLRNHASIASLAKDSLLVFRVVTCLDAQDEPRVTHGVLRIMRRFEPSWPARPEQEWGSAIDLASGALGRLAGDKAPSCGEWRSAHPATGEPVEGRVLEVWPELAEAAIAAHRLFRARALVGWDMAATPDGPVMLEGNSNMDFAFIQRCSETPVGLSPLGPLLDLHLDRLVEARLARFDAAAAGRLSRRVTSLG